MERRGGPQIGQGEAIDVTGLTPDEAFYACASFMAHPSNPVARKRFHNWFRTQISINSQSLESLPLSSVQMLIEAANAGVTNDLTKARKGGVAAGQVLMAVLEMQAAGIPDAGLDKAHYLVSEVYRGAVDHDDTHLRLGRDTAASHWKQYKNVAHLWAAYVTMWSEARQAGQQGSPAVWLDGLRLAALGRAFYEHGRGCLLPRKTSPLVPVDAVRIEGVPAIAWCPEGLSIDQLNLLTKFTPRVRSKA